jgi:hypothetical protein
MTPIRPVLSTTISFRRAEVMAYWMLLTLGLGVVLMLIAGRIGTATPWAWGGLAAGILLPRIFFREWFETGVWVWNGVARRLAAVLRAYVLMVAYRMLFTPVAHGGSEIDLAGSASAFSGWIERSQPHDSFPAATEQDAWYRSLRECARAPRGGWIATLFPVVLLLTLLRDEAHENVAPSRSSYTLF